MPDDIDAAVALEERFHALNLQRAANMGRTRVGPEPNGTCHNPRCGDDVPEGRPFCNAECRDTWEQIRKLRG
jgi:hypothetical protein